MIDKWNGNDERRSNPTDHDSLIRVITILAEHVKNFDNHVLDDKAMAKRVDFSTKIIYMAMGGLAVLQLIGIFK